LRVVGVFLGGVLTKSSAHSGFMIKYRKIETTK
jgi:hypothetical protein